MNSIVVPDAGTADLGPFAAKPTSVSGEQQEAALEAWTSADGRTTAGVWECTPGTFTAVRDGSRCARSCPGGPPSSART
jgi:hypothetical protein